MKVSATLNLKQIKKHKLKVSDSTPRGLFLWIGSDNVVDRIVGYHNQKGFIADYAYNTGNNWLKDLYLSLFKYKNGFVRLTRYI